MENVIRLRLDLRIYADSEPSLYKELERIPRRLRGRYMRNAGIFYADKRPSSTVVASGVSVLPVPMASADVKPPDTDSMTRLAEAIDGQIEDMATGGETRVEVHST